MKTVETRPLQTDRKPHDTKMQPQVGGDPPLSSTAGQETSAVRSKQNCLDSEKIILKVQREKASK